MKKYLTALFATALLTACYNNGDAEEQGPGSNDNPELCFTSFVFRHAANPGLEFDYVCPVGDGVIDVHFPYTEDSSSLVASFEGNFDKALVGGEEQVPGVSVQDFNRVVRYELVGGDGTRRTVDVKIRVAAALPQVWIDTGGKGINSKENYVKSSVRITNSPEHGVYEGTCGIKGRGNATWGYAKKPYKVKLDLKAPVLGMPANRDWVLLAEYGDKSLLRNKYLFTVSELAGLPYTVRSCHVELMLNGTSMGTYLLTEQVEEAKDRVKISDDGFLFEADNYWYEEPLYFKTASGSHFTFKYPDPDDEIRKNDDNYNYITGFMDAFEKALYSDDFKDSQKGYRKYIDAECFARWYLVQELTGNIDTNPYYVLSARGAKLQMYPVWDAEWSLGLANEGDDYYGWALPPAKPVVEKLYWRNKQYFGRLIDDPYFAGVVKAEWTKLKAELPELQARMETAAETLAYAQSRNFVRWPVLGSMSRWGW